jgi:hypothetical protein
MLVASNTLSFAVRRLYTNATTSIAGRQKCQTAVNDRTLVLREWFLSPSVLGLCFCDCAWYCHEGSENWCFSILAPRSSLSISILFHSDSFGIAAGTREQRAPQDTLSYILPRLFSSRFINLKTPKWRSSNSLNSDEAEILNLLSLSVSLAIQGIRRSILDPTAETHFHARKGRISFLDGDSGEKGSVNSARAATPPALRTCLMRHLS